MEDGQWVTINGAHVFVKEGQHPMDAFIRQKGGVKNNIKYNLGEKDDMFSNTIKNNINKLIDEYNSPLEEVGYKSAKETFKTGEAGSVTDYGKKMVIGQAKEDVIYHEFAHTLASEQGANLLNQNKEFWGEIKKVEKSYYKEIREIDKKGISSMKEYDPNFNRLEAKNKIEITPGRHYFEENTDEFFAESFSYAKLGLTNSPYAKKVLEITDKYFKKK